VSINKNLKSESVLVWKEVNGPLDNQHNMDVNAGKPSIIINNTSSFVVIIWNLDYNFSQETFVSSTTDNYHLSYLYEKK